MNNSGADSPAPRDPRPAAPWRRILLWAGIFLFLPFSCHWGSGGRRWVLRGLGSHRPGFWVLQDLCGAFVALTEGGQGGDAGLGCNDHPTRAAPGHGRCSRPLWRGLNGFLGSSGPPTPPHPIPACPPLDTRVMPNTGSGTGVNQSLEREQREEPPPPRARPPERSDRREAAGPS